MSSQQDEDQPAPAFLGRGHPALRSTKLTRPTPYEVGYGKPPEAHRFQKGRSGNPRGRPKGAKNKPKLPGLYEERFQEIVLEEAYRSITVRDGDHAVTVPMAQAIIRAAAVNAAKGQHRAQRLFSELLTRAETAKRRRHDEYFQTLLTYKAEWEKELRRRKQLGITHLPDPLPHPDHVIIDVRAGTACVLGPMTKEEKAEWDQLARQKKALEDDLAILLERIRRTRSPAKRQALQEQIEAMSDALAGLRGAVPD